MGYTHYWTLKKPKRGELRATAKKYTQAIDACSRLVRSYYVAHGGLQGYSAHCDAGEYAGLNFNGARENAHETFTMRERLQDYFTQGASAFDFCKTARKPYDALVVACLCILKDALGDAIDVRSDGDSVDWIEGLELARRATKNKKMRLPSGVRMRVAACEV